MLTRVCNVPRTWNGIAPNSRLIVVDAQRDAVLAVSNSGDVSILSANDSSFGTPRGMVLHTISGTLSALVANDGSGPEAVYVVNLDDGSRRVLVDFGTQADPRDVVIDTSVNPPRAVVNCR